MTIADRKNYSIGKIEELKSKLTVAEKLVSERACVYMTGSFGRHEANEHSDVDLFIVSLSDNNGSKLSRLDDICIKADLICAIRAMKLPEFDSDGRYLVSHSNNKFIENLGKSNDDQENTLTGRLLLFLESKPLLENNVYHIIINDIVAKYWRDYSDHSNSFKPAYLANDILRLWRTFCVNYEASTERTPEENKIKGKIRNYKLKHTRILTCYSTLMYLLSIYIEHSTVSPKDVVSMVQLTPIERLENISKRNVNNSGKEIKEIIEKYERFLDTTSDGSAFLKECFNDKTRYTELIGNTYDFGDSVYRAFAKLGNDSSFYRLMVV